MTWCALYTELLPQRALRATNSRTSPIRISAVRTAVRDDDRRQSLLPHRPTFVRRAIRRIVTRHAAGVATPVARAGLVPSAYHPCARTAKRKGLAVSGAAGRRPGEDVPAIPDNRHDGDGTMHAAIAVPGNSRTILTLMFGRGLEDDRYVVERFHRHGTFLRPQTEALSGVVTGRPAGPPPAERPSPGFQPPAGRTPRWPTRISKPGARTT